MLGMLAVLEKTLTEATRDKITYTEFADISPRQSGWQRTGGQQAR
jgi:hypothetical protein